MATAEIKRQSVVKGRVATNGNGCANLPGNIYISRPVSMFDSPRPPRDASGSLTNDELEKLAERRQPPLSWYDGDEEQVF
jgi:hypothetical protein